MTIVVTDVLRLPGICMEKGNACSKRGGQVAGPRSSRKKWVSQNPNDTDNDQRTNIELG